MNTSLTALEGIRVGHHQRVGRGWLTGTTVVFAPRGVTAGVDIRGGGPGTRETELLRPENLVQQVHAICLSGGSAFGLAAADGVMRRCAELGVGLQIGAAPHEVVPIVPSAIIFDLGRGGTFANHPTAEFGYQATATASRRPVRSGNVGAGTGAVTCGLKGGLGNALRLIDLPPASDDPSAQPVYVAALAVVNAAGSLLNPESGLPRLVHGNAGAFGLRRPDREDRRRLREVLAVRLAGFGIGTAGEASGAPETPSALNTTIGVVATNADLTKAECTKLAQVAHDGLARVANPSHLMVDGDTVFALSTGSRAVAPVPGRQTGTALAGPGSRAEFLNRLLVGGADVFAAACLDALLAARGAGAFPSYRDICPTAFITP